MRFAACLALIALAWPASFALADDAVDRHFAEQVKQLLDARCISCHGPEKQKGGLRLDSRAGILKGGDTGPAAVAGKPKESLLIQAVMHTNPDIAMPPKEKLTARDIDVLSTWIENGIYWPAHRGAAGATTRPVGRIGDAWSDAENPVVRTFGGQRLDLWSLKPVKPVEAPAVKQANWVRNEVDRFVLARLEAAGLKPAAEADRRTLIRRLTFDLIGLPPSPEEVDAFTSDRSPDAYERLVERLLASPRYGEHQARWWLDVVRYSDSNGFDWDEFRPNAWRFRDYVIRSFNADKPFDRFIREQLAGDELLAGPPRDAAEQDTLLATGYLRLGPHDNAAGLFNEHARSRAELMADLVETTGSAMLGMTLSCCRCHDHKYDPLTQADHYRFRAFFEPVKFGDDLSIDLAPARQKIDKHNSGVEKRIGDLQAEREAIKAAGRDRAKQKKASPNDAEIDAELTAEEKSRREELAKKIEELKKTRQSGTKALLMTDGSGKPAVTKVLFGGDHKQERQLVEAGFLSVFDPNPADIIKPENPRTTGRRLTLANWIVSPGNPLTARVLANRVWQTHFGQGIVATPNDFGFSGARPTHPELLDYLATNLMKAGWSIKSLHRLIVASATYRQASQSDAAATAMDAGNTLLWRQNSRRLTAEQLRDNLLASSGMLKDRAGGPPIWPALPDDVLKANPAFLDDNAEKTKGWYPSAPADRNVRTIFLVQKRTVKLPLLETFDQPENATSCGRRIHSTVAPQALSLLNGPDAVAAARALAARVETTAGKDVAGQVQAAFRYCLQRSADENELLVCLQLLKTESLVQLCRALINVNEFVYVE